MKDASSFNIFDAPLVGVNLIEASAGTGKTWNICGLYLRLLLERKLDVHQILVVTFTNAATAELRTRIRARLVDALLHLTDHAPENSDPFIATLIDTLLARRGNTREELCQGTETALLNFDDAAIFTIHSFCQRALADTAFASGQAFTQELIPDDSDIRMEIVHDFWRNQIANASLSSELASYLIEKNVSPAAFDALLKRQLAKPLATYQWPKNEMTDVDGRSLNAAYAKAQTEWKTARSEILKLLNQSLGILNNNSYKEKTIQTAAAGYDFLLEANNPLAGHTDNLKLDLLRSSIVTKRTKGKNQPPQHPFFDTAENLAIEREKLEAQLENARLAIIRQLLESAPETIRHRKRERRLLAYDDLLFNLHDALKSEQYPWLVELLRQRFPAALVDEFQDTDPLQYEIFETLYNGQDNTLYMVGDPKQAIYRFRNADLHSYLRAKQHARNSFTIGNNQRSTDALIHAVNQLFLANPQAFILPNLPFQHRRASAKASCRFCRSYIVQKLAPRFACGNCRNRKKAHLSRHDAMVRATQATANEIARLLSGRATRCHPD